MFIQINKKEVSQPTKPTKAVKATRATNGKAQQKQDFNSDDKPLVAFAAKSRPPVKTNGVRKPLPMIVRKKASLTVKKKLSELTSFSTASSDSTSPFNFKSDGNETVQKSVPSKPPRGADSSRRNPNLEPVSQTKAASRAALRKKTDWSVSNNSSSKAKTGVISSLFTKNLDIPEVSKEHVDTKDEAVFSALSFSSLKIHKFLVRSS